MKKRITSLGITLVLLHFISVPAMAANEGFFKVLSRIVRVGADISDDVPNSSIQRGFHRIDEARPPLDSKALRRAILKADPSLLRELDTLEPAEAQIALRMFGGAEALRKASPDALTRARAVKLGGSDLILTAERYGEDMTAPAFRILAAEDVGHLPPNSLEKFSKIVARRGKRVLDVWNTKVLPNWKLLVGSGLLADILLNDGDLTAAAAQSITKKATETIIDTAVEVPKTVLDTFTEKLKGPDGGWVVMIAAIAVLFAAFWVGRRIKSTSKWIGRFLAKWI